MRSPILIASAIVCASIFAATACKKKQDDATPSSGTGTSASTRITRIYDSTIYRGMFSDTLVSDIIIWYNGDGTVSRQQRYSRAYDAGIFTSDSSKRTFSYYGDKYVITYSDGSDPDTIRINSEGLITSIHTNSYTYTAGTDQLLSRISASDTTSYTWSGANMERAQNRINATSCTYNTDKPAALGDPYQAKEFLNYGRTLTKNKNLTASYSSSYRVTSGYNHTIEYGFDGYKRVSTARVITIGYGIDAGDSSVSYYRYTY